MKALLLFHARAGVRMGLRASAVTLAWLAAWTVFQESPAEFVTDLVRAAFALRPALAAVMPIIVLAFLFPAWAAGRTSRGLHGWSRHLPVTGTHTRRALGVALVMVQLPLVLLLMYGAARASMHHTHIVGPLARWTLVLAAGAMFSLPVRHRLLHAALAALAAGVALMASPAVVPGAALLLLATDAVAGPLERAPTPARWRISGRLLTWTIAWRALGYRLGVAYASGLLVLGAGWLFIHNNQLTGAAAAGPARLFGAGAVVAFLFTAARTLASRRPVWALARSFPWSAMRRVGDDALWLGVHAVPLLLLVAVEHRLAALKGLALVPFLALRAAGALPRMSIDRTGALPFLAEGLLASVLLALVPWTPPLWLVAAAPALWFAADRERRHKVTSWSDWRLAETGETALRSDA